MKTGGNRGQAYGREGKETEKKSSPGRSGERV